MGPEAVGLRAACAVAAILLLAAPGAAAQTLSERLADLTFPQVVITIAPNSIRIHAQEASVTGQTASDLRKCIDNANCPDPSLASVGRGNGDGRVSADEVDSFEAGALVALNTAIQLRAGPFAAFGDALRALVTIDGQPVGAVRLNTLDLLNAEGFVASSNEIKFTVSALLEFSNVGDGNRHRVSIARASTNLQLAHTIIVQAASGWRIREATVEPATLRGYYGDGRISGTQQQLQGSEPLTFEIEKTGLGFWAWVAVVGGLVAAAAAALLFVAWRRKRRKA